MKEIALLYGRYVSNMQIRLSSSIGTRCRAPASDETDACSFQLLALEDGHDGGKRGPVTIFKWVFAYWKEAHIGVAAANEVVPDPLDERALVIGDYGGYATTNSDRIKDNDMRYSVKAAYMLALIREIIKM